MKNNMRWNFLSYRFQTPEFRQDEKRTPLWADSRQTFQPILRSRWMPRLNFKVLYFQTRFPFTDCGTEGGWSLQIKAKTAGWFPKTQHHFTKTLQPCQQHSRYLFPDRWRCTERRIFWQRPREEGKASEKCAHLLASLGDSKCSLPH